MARKIKIYMTLNDSTYFFSATLNEAKEGVRQRAWKRDTYTTEPYEIELTAKDIVRALNEAAEA